MTEENMDQISSGWGDPSRGVTSTPVWGAATSSQSTSGSEASSSSLGWSMSNMPQLGASSGNASGSDRPPSSSSAGMLNPSQSNSVWLGLGLEREPATPGGDWTQDRGRDSCSNSVIGLDISTSDSGDSHNSMGIGNNINRSGGDQWGKTSNESSGWGQPPKSETGSGWGSPTTGPLVNAGTEVWGSNQSGAGAKPSGGQTWGNVSEDRNSSNWGQPANSKSSGNASGWGQQPPAATQAKPLQSQPEWNQQPPRPSSAGWGTSDDKQGPSAWGAPGEKPSVAGAQWSGGGTCASAASQPQQPPQQQPPQQQPPQQQSTQQQSQWGGSSAIGPGSQSQTINPLNAWGNTSQSSSSTNGIPKPIGTQPPMGQQQQQQTGLPVSGTSWAQAAGRGLPPGPKPGPPAPPDNVNMVRQDAISQAVNNNDGWGKTPVRQDRSWDSAEDSTTISNRQAQQKPMGASGAEESTNTWNQPNTGTAIWEATKEPSNSSVWGAGSTEEPRKAAGASGSPNDNDLGTWNGPDNSGGNNSNTWNGPPPNQNNQWGNGNNSSNNWSGPSRSNSNQWSGNGCGGGGGGGGGGGSSSSSSDNAWDDRSDNTWTGSTNQGGPKPDNMWDRNGTSVWGGPSRSEPPPPQGPPPNWRQQAPRTSTSSWGEDDTPSWSDNMNNQPPPQGRPGEGGPGYWGGDNRQSRQQPWNNTGPPNAPMPPHPQQGMGPPQGMDDKRPSVWGQPPPPSKPTSWGEPGMPNNMEDVMWKQGVQQPANYPPSGNKPLHMRSQLLQKLTDMGFKKEDAQDALIRSNMNLTDAWNYLVANTRRPDFDLNEAQQKGRQVRGVGSDSMVDPRTPDGHIVPPVQNTPYSNAQSQLANSQIIGNPMKQQQQPPQGPSLQMPSSSLSSQPSINPSLQQLMPPQLQKQQVLSQGQPIRGQLLGPTAPAAVTQPPVQQQQQHIVQQLQMAVQAGLISPQLLNQQLAPNMLVMLQHLLQLQQLHQQLLSQHQQQLQKRVPHVQQRQKLDNLNMLMNQVRQQIQQQQRQISLAQQTSIAPGAPQPKPQTQSQQTAAQNMPPQLPQEKDSALRDLPNSMGNLSVKESRLNQWKMPSPDGKDGEAQPLPPGSLAPGSKPLTTQTHSSQSLQSKAESVATSNLSLNDSTWSSSSLSTASSWPTTSSAISTTSVASNNSQPENKNTVGAKECPDESLAPGPPNSKELTVLNTTIVNDIMPDGPATGSSAASTSSNSSNDSSGSSAVDMIDLVEEFIPGKLWQGNSMKNIEDDPYLTPGSMPTSAFGIAGPKSADFMNRKDSSISPVDYNFDPNSSWLLGTGISKSASSQNLLGGKQWSSAASPGGGATTLASELWGVPSVKNTRPPPGLSSRGTTWQQPQQPGLNRSTSWAPGDRSVTNEMGSNSWSGQLGQPGCIVLLTNITAQVDANSLRMLCSQHGNVSAFHANTSQGQVLVGYHTRDEAMRAQRSLNSSVLNNTTIRADLMSDIDVGSIMDQATSPATSTVSSLSQWSQSSTAPPRSAPFNKTEGSTPWNGATSIGGGVWGSGLWAPQQDDRHAGSHFLPENLLGGH